MKKEIYLAGLLAGTAFAGFSETASALAIQPQSNQPILWPEGTIPYYIEVPTPWFSLAYQRISSPEAEAQMRLAVAQGVAEWNAVGATNNRFKFVLVNKADVDPSRGHLVINLRGKSKLSECGAGTDEIGYPGDGKKTIVSLPEACPGSIVHELGHVLGFMHEHSRKDANLVLNRCNHIKASDTDCNNIYTNGWASQLGPITLSYLNEYDPFSVMHYDLQNNLKEELVDQDFYDPETGVTYYYTTVDFTRDLAKSNNVFALSERLNLSIAELYDGMTANRGFGAKLSAQDKSAAKAIYERGLVDTHANLAKTCYSHDSGGTNCTEAGQFKVGMKATNFGAWPASNVKLSLPLPANINKATVSWSAPDDVQCSVSSTALVCTAASMPGQSDRTINVTGKLVNADLKISLQATVSTSSTQNPYTLNASQFTSASVSVGGP